MKVIRTTVSSGETSSTIDLFEGKDYSAKIKKRIQNEVGEFLVEQTLVSVSELKSPIQGEGTFPALSKNYKKKKLKEVGHGVPNLEFQGEMLNELAFKPTPEGIKEGIFGERAPAADGHNNLSGKSHLKKRRFLPAEGQTFKEPIKKEVERIIADIVAQETKIKKSDFANIDTKKGLYSKLSEFFGELNRAELKLAVYRNDEVLSILEDLKLDELL